MYGKEIESKPESAEFILMEAKIITDICCRGRMPDTKETCGAVLYQSDGEFLYILGNILNAALDVQQVTCEKCGYTMTWRRNHKFTERTRSENRNVRQRRQWEKPKFNSKI